MEGKPPPPPLRDFIGIHVHPGFGTLSAGLATLAMGKNKRAGNNCSNCAFADAGVPPEQQSRPGVCGKMTRPIACAKWRGEPL